MEKWFYLITEVVSTGEKDSEVLFLHEGDMRPYMESPDRMFDGKKFSVFELTDIGFKKDITERYLPKPKDFNPYMCEVCSEPGSINDHGYTCKKCRSGKIIKTL
jgi:hypothetical protein